MKQPIDERLDELLDINHEAEEVVKETNKQLVPRNEKGQFAERKGEQQIDYKYTRNTLYDWIVCGPVIISSTFSKSNNRTIN